MKRIVVYSLLTSCILILGYSQNNKIKTKKIWDNAPHNAFTDLIRYKNYLYCSFREGTSHVNVNGDEKGEVRILRSRNGNKWQSVVLLNNKKYDLRDPKLSVAPDGKLMVIMGGSEYNNKKKLSGLSHVSFSGDGLTFIDPIPVIIDAKIKSQHDWIWRVTWYDNIGYAVVYQTAQADEWNVRLPKNRRRTNI